MRRFLRWLRGIQKREWFVVGDYSPYQGALWLIGGPYTAWQARREAHRWVRVHPAGQAVVTRATPEVARLPRYILEDYDDR